jgi:thioredoxin-like negative regulator of GroEL
MIVAFAGQAGGQEVRWRHDYAAARKEAAAAGKPLLLDFGSEDCVWCRKLDATTFRQPAVIELLNDRFVPVKVDGQKDAWLSQTAGVEAFPTLVLLSSEGKILARHDGYADAGKLLPLLRQAIPTKPVAPAAPRPPAAELLAQARADHDAGRYLACIERCDRLLAAHPAAREAADARRLTAAITADPAKWGRVTGQLRSDLAALQRDLHAALGR